MKNYINYIKNLNEIVKISDLSNLIGNSDNKDFKLIKNKIDEKFLKDRDLIKFITLDKRIGKDKIRFEINWYNDAIHDLIERIENRTNIKSISEFNNNFKEVINYIFPDKLKDGTIDKSGKYSIHFKYANYSILFYFDINNKKSIDIKTIVSGYFNDVLKTIEFED